MIENINDIEKSLGLEEGKLSEMLSSEDNHTIDLSERVILSKEDFDTRVSNERKEAQKAGVEIAVKNARNELGLDFQGKNIENLLSAHKAKIESGFSADVSEREQKLKADLEAVQGSYTGLQTEFDSFKTSVNQEKAQRKVDNMILSQMPDGLSIPKDDALIIFKSKHKIETGEGGEMQVMDINGNVFQDDVTKRNLGLGDVLSTFSEAYKVQDKQKPKGRGKGDDHKRYKADSFESFDAEMNEAGISGTAYNAEMSKRIQAGTLKI
jgi:hypothetical protein